LIRRTLDISTMSATSLQDEIDYLHNYLILEKMRFGNKFEYTIQNQITAIAAGQLNFPSMILQPYVENAIRHGLRHKQAAPGKLEIKFAGKNNTIICTIDDNGIGRKEAERLKSSTHVEYQSRGIKLSEDKISLYNQINNDNIKVATIDKVNEDGTPAGTLVTVFIPYNTIV
jgi:LytS/YehU family sensor histidine kinase